MGKTLKELFEKGDIRTFNVQDGNVAAPGGKTMQERYDVKNSKDVPVSSAAPLMGLSFFALNKLRIGSNERKKETFLEEELIGIRALRGLSSPVIYGSDIIRLKLESTPMVEKMKQSANGSTSTSLSKFGQQLQQTRNEVNKFLKIPTPLNPTEYYKKLQDYTTEPWELNGVTQKHYIPVYDTMKIISDIKNAGRGSLFGNLIKDSAGSGGVIGKQILGNSLATAKKALKEKIIGTQAVAKNGNNDFERLDEWGDITIKYAQSEDDRYSSGKASKKSDDANLKYNIRDKYNKRINFNPNYPAITFESWMAGSKTYYTNKFENLYTIGEEQPILNERFVSTSPKRPYTLNTNGGAYAINSASPVFEDELKLFKLKYDTFGIGYDKNGNEKTIDVTKLRPSNLKNVKTKSDAPSYSKPTTDGTLKRTLYGDLNDTLEIRRGLGSNRDVINQTGVIPKSEIQNILYKGDTTLEAVDLIPLRFQRVNTDGDDPESAVYFRAIISGFSEAFTPEWEGHKFLGNPFKFYSYKGVERKLSFTIKVYAMSRPELVMMWRRLEYLAHLTYPYSYAGSGFTPSLLYFTLGSVYVNKPAILTSLTYTIDDNEQLWELGEGRAEVSKGENGKSRYEEGFSGKFNTGKDNDTPFSLENSSAKYYNNKVVPKYRIKNENYWSYGYVTEEIPKEDINPIETNGINVSMDEYKLPKFINAQIELTFLESQTNTQKNLYGYGQPITSGVGSAYAIVDSEMRAMDGTPGILK